ncbi:uncharacterized protein BP01DRAFT_384544 [Aspergillus saccharolyticus JOP 1030-1]|uniref:Uncharacterized protein n=1 Tax=Aspergillus saccharolyticus JOP 1030-1 TaxID=1450539 RepID=A0A318ZFC4_9EURO|nr:hypothetical protein BP01DRAFT_384544 [Aspergillus saccharolyticus JOP 1030-1]PYH43343.1 hypothetical protein BP01DRAFT_384544 [Aspergillus saccharolyticus JOP 1030-1]
MKPVYLLSVFLTMTTAAPAMEAGAAALGMEQATGGMVHARNDVSTTEFGRKVEQARVEQQQQGQQGQRRY